MQRRALILGGALAAGSALGGTLLRRMAQTRIQAPSAGLLSRSGPLLVPEGFTVATLSRRGDLLGDLTKTAGAPDGMACFSRGGKWILLRNHELSGERELSAYPGGQPREAFNPEAHGGVSRLVLDPKTLRVESSNMVLTGTKRNCGAGPSPFGYITCEEVEEAGHGYAFLCSPDATSVKPPRPLRGYGRFRHEGVAVDPSTLRAYLTEDQGDAKLYRFTPHDKAKPFVGKLEALRVIGKPGFNTGQSAVVGKPLKVDFVPVEDPEAKSLSTRAQAAARGAAHFSRLEGIWLDGDGVVFTATSGGKASLGQIFRLSFSKGELSLLCEAETQKDFSGPDNITVAPWGDLIFAEDGLPPQHLRGLTSDGKVYPIAQNSLSMSEFAGVCFSPDASTLFCNLQGDGLTLAIRGPFERLRGTS